MNKKEQDFFKSIGVRVGGNTAVRTNGFSVSLNNSGESHTELSKGNARERLFKGISNSGPFTAGNHEDVIVRDKCLTDPKKGSSEGLKNTHGEEFHTDNDKMAEEFVSSATEITLETQKSLSQEDLVLKALGGLSKSDSLITMVPDSNDVEAIMNVHENSEGVREKKDPRADIYRSELDMLCDVIKGQEEMDEPTKTPAQEMNEAVKKDIEKDKNAKPKFVKSYGKGGLIMDFGHRTGIPQADRMTDMLNQFADPREEETLARFKDEAFRNLQSYVEKGEAKFMQDNNDNGACDGSQHQGWNDMLNKPMDQQVVEAFQKGELGKGEENPAYRNREIPNQNDGFIADLRAQAPKNTTGMQKSEIADVKASVGGEIISAQSETDAAVLEMYKGMMDQQNAGDTGGFVASAQAQGVVAGDPLPEHIKAQLTDTGA